MLDTLLQFVRDPLPWVFWSGLGAALVAMGATIAWRLGYQQGLEDGIDLADPQTDPHRGWNDSQD